MRIDLGSVTAYSIAVKYGFEGTEAEWMQAILNAGENAQDAAESAQEASDSATSAENSATSAEESAEKAKIQFGSPLVAHLVADMEDENRVYVYVGEETGYTAGNWYYYDESEWTSGGVYNGEGVNTDPSLSIEDMPADAKAVGDAIEDATSDVKAELYKSTGFKEIPVTATGKYIATNGTTADINSPVDDSRFIYSVVEASEGDKFTINATGGTTPRAWAFIGSNGTVLSVADNGVVCNDLIIEAPKNTAYLIINSKSDPRTSYYGANLSDLVYQIESTVESDLKKYAFNIKNEYVNSAGQTTFTTNWIAYYLKASDILRLTSIKTYSSSGGIGFYQVSFFNSYEPSESTLINGSGVRFTAEGWNISNDIPVPSNAVLCIVSGRSAQDEDAIAKGLYKTSTIIDDVNTLQNDVNNIEDDLLTVNKQLDMTYLLTTKGAIETSNGGTIADNSYMRTDFIPVKAGQVIKYTLRTKPTYSMVSVYDSSKTFVEAVDGINALATGEYTIGQDGFVIFSCYGTYVSYASIQFEGGTAYKLHSSIETANDRITKNFAYLDLADLLTEKGAIDATTGGTTSNNSYFRTDYIPVLSGMVFVYGLRTATNYAMIAMYDTKKTAISQSIVVGTNAMVHSEFTVPQNGYIRICCINTRVSDKTSYFTLKDDRIYNLFSRIKTAEDDISIINADLKLVPEYYKTHIEGKTDDIIANMNSVGLDGETAVFITDTHWDSGNKKSSPSLVNYILQHSNVNVMLCGGDIINQGTYSTQIDLIQSFVDSFRFADVPLPIAFGNHDNNRNMQNPSTEWFDRNTVFAMLMKPASNYVNYLSEHDWSFTFDKAGTKTRFLFIDTGISGEINSNAEQAVFDSLNSVSDGWHVIIVAHWLYSRDNSALTATGENVSAIVDAYNSRSTATINGVTYDYTNAKGKCECILIGHSHDDAQGVTSGGVPWLVSDSDNLGRSKNVDDRTAGTITEQCFDVITFDYANSGVKCCRIGAGSDRTFANGSWS